MWARSNNSESYASRVFSLNDQNFSVAKTKPSKAVREYLDSDEGRLQVTDYNKEKDFGFQQNRGKGSIKQYVTW
jgi:hypothetical protein